MTPNFADRLAAAVQAKRSRLCVGLDPRLDLLPPDPGRDDLERVERFCCAIDHSLMRRAVANLDALLSRVPVYCLRCRPGPEVVSLVRSVL